MKLLIGAFILSLSTLSYANAVLEFRSHVTDWDYESSDQLGERCLIEIFGLREGGLKIDLLATGQLHFELLPTTDYVSSSDLFVATTPASSDSGMAKTRLIVRNKSSLSIEREYTNPNGRIYLSGLTCELRN